jgi:hypothetical protein
MKKSVEFIHCLFLRATTHKHKTSAHIRVGSKLNFEKKINKLKKENLILKNLNSGIVTRVWDERDSQKFK